jgi:type II secretory pathway pseudopilin PulG
MFQGSPITNRSAQSAHTLAEVMVAVLVLATMTVSLFAGFTAGFAIVRLAGEDERATQILNGKLEAIRLCRWSELTNYPVISFQAYYDPPGLVSNSAGAHYNGTITVSPATNLISGPFSYAGNMRLITVTLQWTNFSGKNPIVRTRALQTQVARYGMQNYPWGFSQ